MVPVAALDARLIGRKSTGDSTYWTGLVHGLAELGLDERVVLVSDRPPPPGLPEGSRFRWLQVPGGGGRLWSLLRFPLAARKAGAQVVHTQYAVSPLAGRRAVTTVHDVSFLVEPDWFTAKDRALLGASVRLAVRRGVQVLTVSETSAGEIARLVPGARPHWRWLAPAPGIQPLAEQEALAVVRGLGVEPPYCLAIGTDWPRKNVRLAVEAAGLAGVRLVLTGSPRPGDEPHVQRTGYVAQREMSALYCCADLLLVPSLHEGFGLPVVEGFACGCPVLCSAGGALPEVAGEAAEVAPGFDPQDWAGRISALGQDASKIAAMRERGRGRARLFSWRSHAEAAAAAYEEAARGSHGR